MKYTKPIPNSQDRKPQNKKIVTCPICKTYNLVFSWSFAGSGKKCEKCRFLMANDNINKVLGSAVMNLGVTSTTFRLRTLIWKNVEIVKRES